jgi:amidophosphoribosyltransferase
VEATTLPKARLCRACFDGEYPIPVSDLVGKYILEEPVTHVAPGIGAGDALRHP